MVRVWILQGNKIVARRQMPIAPEVLKMPGTAPPPRSSPVLPLQLVQQRLGLLEIGSSKALGEPAIDLGQELVDLSVLALLVPQPAQTQRCPQFQRLRLLTAGYSEGLLKADFGSWLCTPDSG